MDSLEGNFPVPRKRREEKVRSAMVSMEDQGKKSESLKVEGLKVEGLKVGVRIAGAIRRVGEVGKSKVEGLFHQTAPAVAALISRLWTFDDLDHC